MKTLLPSLSEAIPPIGDTAYLHAVGVAVAEWLALVAVLSIAGAFVLVTFKIIHNFTESRPMALYVTTMLVATVTVIGLLNR
ncbi:hypothetical protein [Paractinoplanes globisporus]|uniref:hypothetical protein n=1 Tax=Paractinoplanes globisporus TaxID=113565 RepID=UPI00146A4BFE|nr:hypothetical protein [Actinoplanes globisporus]